LRLEQQVCADAGHALDFLPPNFGDRHAIHEEIDGARLPVDECAHIEARRGIDQFVADHHLLLLQAVLRIRIHRENAKLAAGK
jgi:hypothetical protein